MLNSIFYKRDMFQPKHHWIEIKYLGAIENPCQQLKKHNENKIFLPILCHPVIFVFSSYIWKMVLFIFYIKCSFYNLFIYLSHFF